MKHTDINKRRAICKGSECLRWWIIQQSLCYKGLISTDVIWNAILDNIISEHSLSLVNDWLNGCVVSGLHHNMTSHRIQETTE
jgi:hypothetical protein